MKTKLFTLLLAVAASVGTIFAESGTCGDNLTWNLKNGVLTISGTGAMDDYEESNYTPWYSKIKTITQIVINHGVLSIGKFAFADCSKLTSVTLPNSLTSIGYVAFGGCTVLTSIEIPNSVVSIGYGAFGGCTGLTSVTIPNSVTSIGEEAFVNCSKLTSVTLPNSVVSIGNGAFGSCTGLTSVTIPNSVVSIGDYAFYGCSSLTSITIPNSVTSIGESAFERCSSATSVVIGNSTTNIGNRAFAYCTCSTYVSCYATTPPPKNGFDFVDRSKITLFVPAESINLYKSANGWKSFNPILPIPTNCVEAAQAALAVSKNNELYNNGAVFAIEGYVTGIKTAWSSQYKNISFWMADEVDGGEILQVFRAVCEAEADAPKVGDKVRVTGSLSKYNNIPEFAAGCTFEIIGGGTTNIPMTINSPQATKILLDGQIYILRGEHVYDAQGKMVK